MHWFEDALMEWFPMNKMKFNLSKFNLLTSSNDELKIYINDVVINSTKCK